MIELKITANSADEITTEILELAKKVTGTKVVETPAKEAPKKEEPKKEEPKKEEPKKEEPKKEEPKKEEPKKEEPKAAEPPATISAEVLEKVKGVVTSPEKRLEMKGWLTDNGFSRVSEVPADRADELLAFVGIK